MNTMKVIEFKMIYIKNIVTNCGLMCGYNNLTGQIRLDLTADFLKTRILTPVVQFVNYTLKVSIKNQFKCL